MEIHKPRAAHSWREFLIEIGTIICGIVIALGLEQGVEALHWDHQVRETKERLSVELGTLLAWSDRRTAQSACIEHRLDDLAAFVDDAASKGRLPPFGEPGVPTFFTWASGAWRSAISAQTVAHLSPRELKGYSDAYGYMELVAEANQAEGEVWTTLYGLAGPGRPFTAEEAGKYRDAISRARFLLRRIDSMGLRARQALQIYHIPFDQSRYNQILKRQGSPQTCGPMTAPPPHYGAAPYRGSLAEMLKNAPLPEYEDHRR